MLPITKEKLVSKLLNKIDGMLHPSIRITQIAKECYLENPDNNGIIVIAYAKKGDNISSLCLTCDEERMVNTLRAVFFSNDKIGNIIRKALR